MIHSLKALALAAATAAAALAGTVAPAAAANFNVYFAVQNNDASASMGITSIGSGITGLGAGPIAAGGLDPATGHAVYSDALPALGGYKSTSFTANVYGSPTGSPCTFTLKVTKDTNALPYLLHFGVDNASRCAVPADVRTSDGEFTAQTYVVGWQT